MPRDLEPEPGRSEEDRCSAFDGGDGPGPELGPVTRRDWLVLVALLAALVGGTALLGWAMSP